MSELKVTGQIKEILEVEKGTSKSGKEWQKLNFVIDTGNEYNPLICFQIFGEDKVEKFTQYNKVGQTVDVKFNVSSREFNGKYYHNLDAWSVFSASSETTQEPQIEDSGEDEMPF